MCGWGGVMPRCPLGAAGLGELCLSYLVSRAMGQGWGGVGWHGGDIGKEIRERVEVGMEEIDGMCWFLVHTPK